MLGVVAALGLIAVIGLGITGVIELGTVTFFGIAILVALGIAHLADTERGARNDIGERSGHHDAKWFRFAGIPLG